MAKDARRHYWTKYIILGHHAAIGVYDGDFMKFAHSVAAVVFGLIARTLPLDVLLGFGLCVLKVKVAVRPEIHFNDIGQNSEITDIFNMGSTEHMDQISTVLSILAQMGLSLGLTADGVDSTLDLKHDGAYTINRDTAGIAMNNAPGLRFKGTAGLLMCQNGSSDCDEKHDNELKGIRSDISTGFEATCLVGNFILTKLGWEAFGDSFKFALDLIKRKVTYKRAGISIYHTSRPLPSLRPAAAAEPTIVEYCVTTDKHSTLKPRMGSLERRGLEQPTPIQCAEYDSLEVLKKFTSRSSRMQRAFGDAPAFNEAELLPVKIWTTGRGGEGHRAVDQNSAGSLRWRANRAAWAVCNARLGEILGAELLWILLRSLIETDIEAWWVSTSKNSPPARLAVPQNGAKTA
ncbi:hypothetical protein B0H13DRAFT_2282504 [Mycena leptocephala]|nr:hypothetical protein B0H13DRAFT_2282504 [Mycena leptocephala]